LLTPGRRPALAGWLALVALTIAGCGASGPDLVSTLRAVDAVRDQATADELGVQGADASTLWRATGSPSEVADAIAGAEPPDERSDDVGGDVYLLYRSGTLWLTPSDDGDTAVVVYDDNNRAYDHHSRVLVTNSRWGSRINSYSSSGGRSSGNGFRGGGSGSGK
jgi:uncharacterized membrane protein YgcG